MIAAALLSLILQAGAPAASAPETDGQRAVREHPQTLFNFFRARAFHDMAVAADCLRMAPERTRDLNARFEAARTRFAALIGAGVLDRRGNESAADGRDCSSALLFGYEDKIVLVERNLADGAP
ncbi:MAG TPA: hypothetical protein VEC11_09990 [Allosphingosinicella sp.]|nr:hypothetical protein [Allosphingosinicella sp.]